MPQDKINAGKPRDALEAWLEEVASYPGGICYVDTVKFYLPTCEGKCQDAVVRFIKTVNKIFGGSTNYEAEGCWVDPEGQLICEPVVVVESSHHCTDEEQAKTIANALLKYAEEANQQYLAVSQGKFYSFPAKYK